MSFQGLFAGVDAGRYYYSPDVLAGRARNVDKREREREREAF